MLALTPILSMDMMSDRDAAVNPHPSRQQILPCSVFWALWYSSIQSIYQVYVFHVAHDSRTHDRGLVCTFDLAKLEGTSE